MLAMGIDMGTTTISMIIMEGDSGKIIGSRTIAHHGFIEGHIPEAKIQDAEKMVQLVLENASQMAMEYGKVQCIGLTGQMHGMLYVDCDGNAVSPLYIWQDGCGNLLTEDGRSYAEVLRETGGAASTGFGLVSHYYLQKNNRIPKEAVKMVTICDYLGMKLCGRKEPVIAKDMAASWGCFDLKKGEFLVEEMKNIGVDISYLPELISEHDIMGYTIMEEMKEVPVIVSLGDNQASVLGSVQDLCDTLLINIGTGSQVSMGTTQYQECNGSIELRPCIGETSLMVGAGLCGGRAYAMLENFYREVCDTEESMYEKMEAQARRFMEDMGMDAAWKVKTTFSGTRSKPEEKGSIWGIGIENFHPGAMTLGMLTGMLEELYEMYLQMCEKTGKKATRLVGSGNGIRKNTLLQELAEQLFGMPLLIPVCQEEAAYGAALHALAVSGIVSGMEEASQKISYC